MNISEIHAKAQDQFDLIDSAPVDFIVPTGSVLLDRALSIGGYPSGRIIEIYGVEMSGKTTLALHGMANAQAMGKDVALIDMERALDQDYAKKIGLKGEPNVEGGYIHEAPDYGEQAFKLIEYLITTGIKFIVVDSVSALIPKAELEGDYGESHMGLQARMMSQALRKITGMVYENDVILVFINQIRMKIGVVFGNPEVTTGGKALPFYSTIRIELRPNGDEIKSGTDIIGKYSRAKIRKNKLGAPMRVVMIPIIFGRGVWRSAEIFDEMLTNGLITKKSSFYYYEGNKIGAGKSNTMDEIDSKLEFYEEALHEYQKNKES